MRELLVRPAPMPDEWRFGYIVRALGQNGHLPGGHERIRRLSHRIAGHIPNSFWESSEAGPLVNRRQRGFGGHVLPAWALRGERSAVSVCPACFHDNPYIRLSWRLVAVTHCETHEQPLRDHCRACGCKLNQGMFAHNVCRCGAPLGYPVPQGAASTTSVQSATVIGAAVFSSQEVTWALSASMRSRGPCAEVVSLIVFLGQLLPKLAGVGSDLERSHERDAIPAFLARLGLELTFSADWISELWRRLPSVALLRTALSFVLKLERDEGEFQTELSGLPLRRWATHLVGLGACTQTAERRGWLDPLLLKRGLIDANTAARRVNVSKARIMSLVRRNVVRPVRVLPGDKSRHLFGVDQLEKLEMAAEHWQQFGQRQELGLSRRAHRAFLRSGLLAVVGSSGGKVKFDPFDLGDLLVDLEREALAIEVTDAALVCLATEELWSRRYILAMPRLLAMMCVGEVRLWSWGDGIGFGRYFLGVDALMTLYTLAAEAENASRPPPPETMELSGASVRRQRPRRQWSAPVAVPLASSATTAQLPLVWE